MSKPPYYVNEGLVLHEQTGDINPMLVKAGPSSTTLALLYMPRAYCDLYCRANTHISIFWGDGGINSYKVLLCAHNNAYRTHLNTGLLVVNPLGISRTPY